MWMKTTYLPAFDYVSRRRTLLSLLPPLPVTNKKYVPINEPAANRHRRHIIVIVGVAPHSMHERGKGKGKKGKKGMQMHACMWKRKERLR